MKTFFPRRFSLLVLALALAVLFYRVILGEVFFWGLPALQFVPWRDYAFDLLRQGQLPLWNPYNGAGAPLLANYQSALLYPLNWISFALPLAWSMSVIAILHLFIAGWGMWVFAGRLGISPLGRGVSALAFGLTTYLVGRLGTYPIVTAAAWLPWLLWAAHGVLASGRSRDGAWLALFAALQLLAGHAQTAWYSFTLVAFYALWLTVFPSTQIARNSRLRRLLSVALLLVLGAGIAALQLLPTAELLASSQRSEGVDFDFAMNFSYAPLRLLNLLSPNVFGTPADGSYIVKGYYFEFAVYVGLIPLISAIAAVIAWFRSRRSTLRPAHYVYVPFWALVVLIGFVFALGNFTPIFPLLYRYVPTFDLFQAPVRWHLWTVCALSVLSGIGVSAWGRNPRTRRWAGRILVASIAAVIVALAITFTIEVEGVVVLARALAITSLFVALACWLTLRQPELGGKGYKRWATLVLVVIALDLGWAAWGLNPTVPSAFYEPIEANTDGLTRGYWPDAAEQAVKFDTFLPPDDYRIATDRWQDFRATELPNLNLLDRRYFLNNFDPLLVGQFASFLQFVEATGVDPNLLRGVGVGVVYDEEGTRQPLEAPYSRVWFARNVCWQSSDEAIKLTLPGAPLGAIHILGDAGCDDPQGATDMPPGSLILSDEANRVQIDIDAPFDGWLLLADTDYPGWVADVDGTEVPIYRANLAFRVVQVPPGQHRVTFSYQPRWLVPGLVVTIVSILVTLVLFRLHQDDNRES